MISQNEQSDPKSYFFQYETWEKFAEILGWMHCHDNFIVVDDSDTGICLGEFNSETNEGWIYSEFVNFKKEKRNEKV